MSNEKIVQESPLVAAEELMGSFISGYLKVPPKLENATWEGDHPIWQFHLEFENTPHDECKYAKIIAPAPAGFEGQLGYLQRLQFILKNLRSPAEITYSLAKQNKWFFESPDRTLAQVLNEGEAYNQARKLELEKVLSKGEVVIRKRVDTPIKTRIEDGFTPQTIIEVVFYESLETAYLVGQEIAQRLKAIYSGTT